MLTRHTRTAALRMHFLQEWIGAIIGKEYSVSPEMVRTASAEASENPDCLDKTPAYVSTCGRLIPVPCCKSTPWNKNMMPPPKKTMQTDRVSQEETVNRDGASPPALKQNTEGLLVSSPISFSFLLKRDD